MVLATGPSGVFQNPALILVLGHFKTFERPKKFGEKFYSARRVPTKFLDVSDSEGTMFFGGTAFFCMGLNLSRSLDAPVSKRFQLELPACLL